MINKDKQFGLLGKTLKYSYSKIIHEKFGKYEYELIELEPEQLSNFVNNGNYNGYNVTIPYKKEIIKHLDVVDEKAKRIGAVNTVVVRNGKKYGYNTDYDGMKFMLEYAGINVYDKNVMVLGSGGTSCTAKTLLSDLNAKKIITVSRTGEINYENCYLQTEVQVLINTTPLGMYPNSNQSPVDLSRFPNLESVVDVVYNPLKTKLTQQAEKLNIKNVNGLPMLVAQAKYAMELFTNESHKNQLISAILQELKREMTNIVLVGMPGCGKSTIGKLLSKKLNRELLDTDELVENIEGCTIPEIFSAKGEKYFREVESQAVKKASTGYGKIISTGGGAVVNELNTETLKQNGRIYYVNREIDKLAMNKRPLSKDRASLEILYSQRKDKYNDCADVVIDNNLDINKAVEEVLKDYENTFNQRS